VVDGFINLNYPPCWKTWSGMSVLDPMLFLGGFYLPPFHVKSEQSVEITTEDEGDCYRQHGCFGPQEQL